MAFWAIIRIYFSRAVEFNAFNATTIAAGANNAIKFVRIPGTNTPMTAMFSKPFAAIPATIKATVAVRNSVDSLRGTLANPMIRPSTANTVAMVVVDAIFTNAASTAINTEIIYNQL